MRSIRKIKTLILLIAVSMAACSTRQVYETSTVAVLPISNAININTASTEELEKLPHIGRKTAETIVRFREENGPFRRPEHLLQTRGVSEKRFLVLRQYLKTE